MSPPRFYCPQIAASPNLAAARYFLEPAEAKHATSVLRLRVDDQLALFDGQGREALAKVIEAKRDTVSVEVIRWQEPDREQAVDLTLVIALPKGDRQKTLVDAATELGVTRLVPLLSHRAVAQPTDSALDRLRRQVIEACKQCGRNRLMEISSPITISQLATSTTNLSDLRVVAHPYDISGPRLPLAQHLMNPPRTSMLAIGPEGGFTDEEVSELSRSGWSIVDLGPLVLRIEIAAIAAIAQLAGWYHKHVETSDPQSHS